MSSFRWKVSEPASGAASEFQSGTIDLENIGVVSRRPLWRIETADGSVTHVPQPSGEVELQKPAAATANDPIVSKGVINFGLVVFIVLAALLVIYGMFTGSLALFKEFIGVIIGFLAGLGIRNVARQSKAPARSRVSRERA